MFHNTFKAIFLVILLYFHIALHEYHHIHAVETVRASGSNKFGQLGAGYLPYEQTPLKLNPFFGVDIDVVQICNGYYYTLFRTAGGKVYSAGSSLDGLLGRGTLAESFLFGLIESYVDADGTVLSHDAMNITHVECGSQFTMYLNDKGEVFSAGRGRFLGHGSTLAVSVPKQIAALANETVKTLSSGETHTIFYTESGKFWATGQNDHGAMCIGDEGSSYLSIEPIPPFLSADEELISIASGNAFNIILSNKTVYGCGLATDGRLGLGDTSSRSTPEENLFLRDLNIISIAVGSAHSVFLNASGTVFVSGPNGYGALGLSGFSSRLSPEELTYFSSQAIVIVSIAAGHDSTVFLSSTGRVFYAGRNDYGNGGLGNTVAPPTSPIVEVSTLSALGNVQSLFKCYHSHFYRTSTGDLFGSGTNANNEMIKETPGTAMAAHILAALPNGDSTKDIETGEDHSIILAESGNVYTVGRQNNCQGGLGTTSDVPSATLITSISPVALGNDSIVHISAGSYFSVFVTQGGKVWTVGSQQMAVGYYPNMNCVPQQITTLDPYQIVYAAAGDDHALLLTSDGQTWCTGRNGNGPCGLSGEVYFPRHISFFENETVTNLAGGAQFSLFTTVSGRVYASGYTASHRNCLGRTGPNAMIPEEIPFLSNRSIDVVSAGQSHSIFLSTSSGVVYSCGSNNFGMLGLGTTSSTGFPEEVTYFSSRGIHIIDVKAGSLSTYFLSVDGDAYFAGQTAFGQSGSIGVFISTPTKTLPEAFSISKLMGGNSDSAFWHSCEDGKRFFNGSCQPCPEFFACRKGQLEDCRNSTSQPYPGAGIGNSECSSCISGFFFNATSGTCHPCTPGYYCPGASARIECPSMNSTAGASSLSDCFPLKCFDIGADNSAVCSGNGICTAEDACTCEPSYFGPQCENFLCFGDSDPNACGGARGTCVGANNCSCIVNGYSGAQCENYTCFGIDASHHNVCSSHGACLIPDQCSCSTPYSGANCDHIACPTGYGGALCDQHICFGVAESDSIVCSGRGSCTNVDTCECDDGVFGTNCQTFECFGQLNSDPGVCSGQGSCVSPDNCFCNSPGYTGSRCQTLSCDDLLLVNNTSGEYSNVTCSGHGECTGPNMCTCDKQWDGVNCQECAAGWTGSNCSEATCDCLDRGECLSDMTCDCMGNFAPPYCRQCLANVYGVECNMYCDSKITCSNHGTCEPVTGGCVCQSDDREGHYGGGSCQRCESGWVGHASCSIHFDDSSWKFNSLGDGIVGVFHHPVANQIVDCSALLPVASEREAFGSDLTCQWIQNDHANGDFTILFGSNPTLQVGDSIEFDIYLGDAIEAIGASSTRRRVNITAPVAGVDVPIAIIRAQREVGSCDDVILDGSSSTSFDGRPLVFKWGLSNAAVIGAASLNLVSFLSAQSNSILSVNATLLAPDVVHDFKLVVSNFLGETAEASMSLTRRTTDIPQALVLGGGVRKAGSGDYIILEGTLQESACISSSEVGYEWQQVAGSPVSFSQSLLDGRRVVLDGANNALPHFAATYVFEFTTYMLSYPLLNSSAQVTVQISPKPMQLSFVGGAAQHMLFNSNFTLKVQVGGYENEQSSGNISYNWLCVVKSTLEDCPNSNLLPKTSTINTLLVPHNMLPSGTTYIFRVTAMRSGTSTSVSSVEVSIVGNGIPRVVMDPYQPHVNPNERFVLEGNLVNAASITISEYFWTAKRGENVLTSAQMSALAYTPTNQRVLGIAANSLLAGQSYSFALNARSSSNQVGFAQAVVKVNNNPRPGFFTVTPSSGEVLSTEFSIVCGGWRDDDLPLMYRMTYADPSNPSRESSLVFKTLSNSFKITIPVPGLSSNNHTLTLRLYVSDKFGATTQVSQTVRVTPFNDPHVLTAALNRALQQQQQKLSFLRAEEKVTSVAHLASALNAASGSQNTSQIRDALFAIVDNLNNSNDSLPESVESVKQRTDMVSRLIFKTTPMDRTLSQQRSVVARFLSSAATSPNLRADSAHDLLGALSSISYDAEADLNTDETSTYFSSVQNVGSNLLSQQTVGQSLTLVESSKFSIGVVRKLRSDIGSSVQISNNTVEIPESLASAALTPGADSLGIQLQLSSRHSLPNSDNVTSSIFSVSFSGSTSEVSVKDLPDPIILYIPFQYDLNVLEWNETQAGFRPSCRYWNTTRKMWDSDGGMLLNVIQSNDSTSAVLVCAFSHTTDFASVVQYTLPSFSIPDVTLVVKLNTDNMTALIVIVCLVALYILVLIIVELLSLFHPRVIEEGKPLHLLQENSENSAVRTLLDRFKQSHIWVAVLSKPTLGKTNFTRSMFLTLIMVTICGILVSNALTFGQTQANLMQTILAGIFSDFAAIPFVVFFTIAFGLVKARKAVDKEPINKEPPFLSEKELSNPFDNDDIVSSVKDYVVYVEEQQKVARGDPYLLLNPTLEKSVKSRMKKPLLYSDDNVHDVITPIVTNVILDEQNEFLNEYDKDSLVEIFDKRYNIHMDALDEFLRRFQKWNQLQKREGGISKVALLVFFVASILYFSLLGLIDACVITTVKWIGERGAIIISVLGVVAYIATCILLYLYARFKFVNAVSDSSKVQASKQAVFFVLLISVSIVTVCIVLMCVLAVIYFMKLWMWLKLDYFIVFEVGCGLVIGMCACLIMFSLYIPDTGKKRKARKKKGKKKKKPKVKKEGFGLPWWSRYIVYLLAWLYIGTFSYLIVVYGIQFDNAQKGSAWQWIGSSLFGLGQNILLNKPVVFVIRVIVLVSMSTMFEELAFFSIEFPDVPGIEQ